MKNETTKTMAYISPEIEVIDVMMVSVVCQSPCDGDNQDNTDDEL